MLKALASTMAMKKSDMLKALVKLAEIDTQETVNTGMFSIMD